MQDATNVDAGPHPSRALLISCLSGIFLTPYLGASVNVALPELGRAFHLGAAQLNGVTTAFVVAAAVCLVPVGRLADRLGRKRVFVTGIVAVALTALLSGLAPDGPWLIASRIAQGVGSSLIFATGAARLAGIWPQRERGRVMGYAVATVYLGLSLGPFIGGWLTGWLGWRAVFLSAVPLCLLALALELRQPAEPPRTAPAAPYDTVGAALYVLALLGFVAAALLMPSSQALWALLAGGALFAVLLRWEAGQAEPILDVALWRGNRVFACANAAALINYGATFAVGFLLSLYLQYNGGLGPRDAGLVLVTQPLLMALLSPLAGRVSDRWNSRWLTSLGMALTGVGLGILLLLPQDGSLSVVIAALAVVGIGIALFSSPNTNVVLSSVPPRDLGVANATVSTMRLSGQMVSMAIVLAVFRSQLGSEPVTAEHHAGLLAAMRACLVVFIVLCALGVLASLARGRSAAAAQA